MTLRTKGEQKAYLDGFEMCAKCIEKYLTFDGKQKLDCLLVAVRNAVEAAEQPEKHTEERTESHACDCISREAARNALLNKGQRSKRYKLGETWELNLMEIEEALEELPSVEPESKTGKWFLLDECANEGRYCDQCHKKVFRADFSNTMRKYKFCPNCGAKMEVDG